LKSVCRVRISQLIINTNNVFESEICTKNNFNSLKIAQYDPNKAQLEDMGLGSMKV